MSKTMNGRIRKKSVREAYVEQFPYNKNKKRKSFTRLHSYDDTDIAYRGTPDYLRQLMNTSTLLNGNSTRSLTRTYSASELASRNLGNPKYKAQEDYYDEIQLLKKELKYSKDDNSNLRAKIRRLEGDNARKYKEIDGLYDGDLRRTLAGSSTPTSNVVLNLKQRLFKLELQLKQRETIIDEMKNDPRWTKSTELEIQNRALFNELEKQKFERLNFIQHDYMTAIGEETKNIGRKLETVKRELTIENENLKKKLHEFEKSGKYKDRSEQLSARQHDGNTTDRDFEELKKLCRKYEHEIDQMKDELKHVRRERDKYRDKFENIKEELEEIKRDRQTGRSSPGFKRDDERFHKRPQSAALHRDLNLSDEFSKKDSRPSTPIKKFNEHIHPRSSLISKKSSQNLRYDKWTSDHDYRVKNFREKHAATVIQRGWRKHRKSHKHSFFNRTKHDGFDKRNSKMGGIVSPRANQQKFGSKIENFGSGPIKNRPLSANVSNESALKIVQAALRGHINRTELDKPSRTQKSQRDDDDIIITSSRQRENFLNYSKQNFGDNHSLRHDKIGSNSRLSTSNRDFNSKVRRTPSPPIDNYRPSSPHSGSKQNLFNDRNKLGSGNRFSMNDRELLSKPRRSLSPPADIHRSSSPRNTPIDKNKFSSGNRLDRDSPLKFQRPSSPLNDPRLSPHNSLENTRQNNLSFRKSPTNSKQSLKNTYKDDDDDDGIFDF